MVSFHSKSLIHTAPNQGERVYDDPAFKYMLLEHLPNLLNNDNLISIPIDQQLADMYYGDYYGLLTRLKISPYMHWIVTRLNGLTDSMDYNSDSLMVYIPLESELDRLKILFLSTNA